MRNYDKIVDNDCTKFSMRIYLKNRNIELNTFLLNRNIGSHEDSLLISLINSLENYSGFDIRSSIWT